MSAIFAHRKECQTDCKLSDNVTLSEGKLSSFNYSSQRHPFTRIEGASPDRHKFVNVECAGIECAICQKKVYPLTSVETLYAKLSCIQYQIKSTASQCERCDIKCHKKCSKYCSQRLPCNR